MLAIARSASSVSYKDALARTIAKNRRGAITGFATSTASISVFAVGLLMASDLFEVAVPSLSLIVAIAGAAFMLASFTFLRMHEPEGDAPREPSDAGVAELFEPLTTDRQLRLFIASRIALSVTALAPPFIIMLAAQPGDRALSQLGPLVMASTAATFFASYAWGRLADYSSRQTLMYAGVLGAMVFAVVGAVGLNQGDLCNPWGAVAAIFFAQTAYAGVRAGRSLHLVDMAEDSFRARYVALSNTLVGLALLGGGLFGLMAEKVGPSWVMISFAILAMLGAVLARQLREVQR